MRPGPIDIIVNERAQNATRPDLIQAIAPYLAMSWEINQEIANPLTGIMNLTEHLLSEDEENFTYEQRESLLQIAECALRINAVVETLHLYKSAIMENDYLRNRMQAVIGRISLFKADD